MRRSSRRQRVCSIIAAFVQSGRNSAIDVLHRRVSFDPREFQLPRSTGLSFPHNLSGLPRAFLCLAVPRGGGPL